MENKDFINLIPSHKNPSPDYYCTWQTQLYATSGGTPAPFPKTATSLRMSGGSTVKTKIYTEPVGFKRLYYKLTYHSGAYYSDFRSIIAFVMRKDFLCLFYFSGAHFLLRLENPLFARIICAAVYSATGTAFAAQALKTFTPQSRNGLAKYCTVPAA